MADEEYEMPCAEALLAGTLALMTGHALQVVSAVLELDQHRALWHKTPETFQ